MFFANRQVQRAFRDERWKLIRYPEVNVTQLFDLENDPAEMHDLSADPAQTTRVAAMMARLKKSQEVFGDALP